MSEYQKIEIPKKYIYYHGEVIDPQTFEPINAFKIDKKFETFIKQEYKVFFPEIEIEDKRTIAEEKECRGLVDKFSIKFGGTFSDNFVEDSKSFEKIRDLENKLKIKLKFKLLILNEDIIPCEEENKQWVCILKDIDNVPFIVNSEKEAKDLLSKWNTKSLGNEGTISKLVEDYTLDEGKFVTITKLYLTCDGFDVDDPYATATLYNYEEYINYTTDIPPEELEEDIVIKTKNVYNPLLGESQPYGYYYHVLKLREIEDVDNKDNTRISIQILKEIADKNNKINNQKDIFDWFDSNAKSIIKHCNKDSSNILSVINYASNELLSLNKRGKANIAIVGNDIYSRIKNDVLVVKNLSYSSSNFLYFGTNFGIDFYTPKEIDTIPENKVYLSYVGSGAVDLGVNLLKENNDLYLNYIDEYNNYIRIVEFDTK